MYTTAPFMRWNRLRIGESKITFTKCAIAFTAIAALLSACGAATARPTKAAHSSAATGPERALVGVHIYDKASVVLKKFGNGFKVITGGEDTTTSSTTEGVPSRYQSLIPSTQTGGTAGIPGAPGANADFAPAGAQQGGQQTTQTAPDQVVYRYTLKNDVRVDFTFSSDGRVVQITAAGAKGAEVKTNKSVTLGTPYTTVLDKYGFPEHQQNENGFLTARYTDKSHVAFQFYQNKVVSITVTAAD